MWLIVLAVVGLLAPGGLFLYWMFNDYTTLSAALSDRMALAFFVDLLMSTFLLAYLFARKPLGPVKWPWFIMLSLLGTLAFGIPLFIWLNCRRAPEPRTSLLAWWRAVWQGVAYLFARIAEAYAYVASGRNTGLVVITFE